MLALSALPLGERTDEAADADAETEAETDGALAMLLLVVVRGAMLRALSFVASVSHMEREVLISDDMCLRIQEMARVKRRFDRNGCHLTRAVTLQVPYNLPAYLTITVTFLPPPDRDFCYRTNTGGRNSSQPAGTGTRAKHKRASGRIGERASST